MEDNKMLRFLKNVLDNMPAGWLSTTTHRLDIYNEKLAKTEFLSQFEVLYVANDYSTSVLQSLPTAYDYIRLGHPLSCVLEWAIAKLSGIEADRVVSFSSNTIPLMAVLRANLLANKKTQIIYTDSLPHQFDADVLRSVYGYEFDVLQVADVNQIPSYDGTTILYSQEQEILKSSLVDSVDFYITSYGKIGSVLLVTTDEDRDAYISEIQHVRRRETIAMTPSNCRAALNSLLGKSVAKGTCQSVEVNRTAVVAAIQDIADTSTQAVVGSSGLSIQYAIMMGLIHHSKEEYEGKKIKFIVPPNCYGGTNDQARRVAACLDYVEVLDLPVDGKEDMVAGVEKVLDKVAQEDAVPFIIAEIPTNPRVEVPDLMKLKQALGRKRRTQHGEEAIAPVFVLDQTFCPNVHFLGEDAYLSTVKTISYASGSKFPSGGRCTAGYCIGNKSSDFLMEKISAHLELCDNGATGLQLEVLAEQLPSMNQRITMAYQNTREFVKFIQETLPEAKINFVPESLAEQGFTPSVFSLDLPTRGETAADKEAYKRKLNHLLIDMMIKEIPTESKYCVSYGQLKGCYWTIPATSTQGTTKEGDKDYIARVGLSPDMDLERHKEVFRHFVSAIETQSVAS